MFIFLMLKGNNSSTTYQSQVKLLAEEVDSHLQLLMLENLYSELHIWSQTSLIVNINPLFRQSF